MLGEQIGAGQGTRTARRTIGTEPHFKEGEGVVATADGQFVTWRGIGVGRLGADGSVSYRGSLSYTTVSTKLARLNGIAGVFEFEVEPGGKTHSKIWEWK